MASIMRVENYQALSDALQEKLLETNPSNQQLIEKLQRHYQSRGGDTLNERARNHYVLLSFLTSPDLERTYLSIRHDIGLRYDHRKIVEFINTAPTSWLKQSRDEFAKKGLIRGSEKYFMMSDFLREGGEFDQLRGQISPDLDAVVLTMIDCYSKGKNIYHWHPNDRLLGYALIQLMPDSPQKEQKLEQLAANTPAYMYDRFLRESADNIDNIAKNLGLEHKLPQLRSAGEEERKAIAAKLEESIVQDPCEINFMRLIEQFKKGAEMTKMKPEDTEVCLYMMKHDGNGHIKLRPAMEVHTWFNAAVKTKIDFDRIYDLQREIPKVLAQVNGAIPSTAP